MKKKKDHRSKLISAARKHSALALIYADDGAWATAAKLLHEAAELFENEHSRIKEIVGGSAVAIQIHDPPKKRERKGKAS